VGTKFLGIVTNPSGNPCIAKVFTMSRRRSRSPVRGGGSEPRPVSLLIRNLSRDIRPEELRHAFERHGAVRDIYLPRDYHTGFKAQAQAQGSKEIKTI